MRQCNSINFGRTWLPLVFSLVAIAISAFTAVWVLLVDTQEEGLKEYDFSSPQAALVSQLEIAINQDRRALAELELARNGFASSETLETLVVHKEITHEEKRILLFSYAKDGVSTNGISAFERDANLEKWLPVSLSLAAIDDASVRRDIQEWTQPVLRGFDARAAMLGQSPTRSKDDTTMTQMKILDDQCQRYRLDMGTYPQSLEDLIVEPNNQGAIRSRWRGPYLDGGQIPPDGWGNPFELRFDETHKPFIYSYGEDGIDGTEDDLSTQ